MNNRSVGARALDQVVVGPSRSRALGIAARLVGVYLAIGASLLLIALFVASGLTFGARWTPNLAIAAACVSLLPLAVAQAWLVHERVQAQAPHAARSVRRTTDDLAGILASTAFLLCVPVLLESAHGVAGVWVASLHALGALVAGAAFDPIGLVRHELAAVRTSPAAHGTVQAAAAWVSALTMVGATLSGASLWLRLRGVVGPGQARRTLGMREPTVRSVALGLMAGALAGWLPASMAFELGQGHEASALGAFARGAEALKDFDSVGVASLAWVVAIALALPIAEELAFRGFLWSAFARAGSPGAALTLTAVSFALLHHDGASIPSAAFLGLVLGVLRVKSGSVIPCVVAHVALNSLGVGAMGLWPNGMHVPLTVAAILGGLALLAAGGADRPDVTHPPPVITRTARAR